jgi:hypothetical protein
VVVHSSPAIRHFLDATSIFKLLPGFYIHCVIPPFCGVHPRVSFPHWDEFVVGLEFNI